LFFDGEVCDVDALVVELFLRVAVEHHAADLRAQAICSYEKVIRLHLLTLCKRDGHAIVTLLNRKQDFGSNPSFSLGTIVIARDQDRRSSEGSCMNQAHRGQSNPSDFVS
jgi:hypothetical protein